MKKTDKATSVNAEAADNNGMRGDHILHGQAFHAGHGVSAIPDEAYKEI